VFSTLVLLFSSINQIVVSRVQIFHGFFSNESLRELQDLINKHSKENDSDTPDFILAQYVVLALTAFNTAIQQRETWYGRGADGRA